MHVSSFDREKQYERVDERRKETEEIDIGIEKSKVYASLLHHTHTLFMHEREREK